MINLGMTKAGSTTADHFAKPATSAVCAHRESFAVRESCSEGILVLAVDGAVDLLSAPQLAEAICGALGEAPAGFIVDLTGVEFLSVVGISVLVAAREAADAMSVRFGTVAEGAATSRPIRLLGIDTILALYPTLADALRDLR
jgi:anti-sigma B factor antagonist